MQNFDAVVIGSGLGGLVAGAMLTRSGKRVIICESHTIAGGADPLELSVPIYYYS